MLISLWGHSTLSSQPCNMVMEGGYHCNLVPKDSVLHEHSTLNGFEDIRIVHKNKNEACYNNLKQIKAWEVREYVLRQKNAFKQMEFNILEQIPIQTLEKFLGYKFNPIVCKLVIVPHEGVVKDVSFRINQKVLSFFTNHDILTFEKIILNTQFQPEDSMNGSILSYNWVIGRKQIREYLNSQNREK